MTRVNFFSLLLIISAIMFLPANLFSRVTIGSTETPQDFSVLELFSNETMGFRLPQLSEYQRDNHLTPMLAASPRDPLTGVSPAMGLQIFNTCNQCVETWNGERWISHCVGDTPPLLGNSSDNFEPNANNRITTFVNVVYDFQHQTLETFFTAGSTANSFQWELSILDSEGNPTTWRTIRGATENTFRIPEGFVYTIGALEEVALGSAPRRDNAGAEVRFRVITDGTHSTAPENQLSILFINTRTSGYSTDANGVRSLLMNRAAQTIEPATGNTIRVALLNLGQSGTGAWRVIDGVSTRVDTGTPLDDSGRLNDAGDLGDLFQWGRIADGHQHIVWSKPATGTVRNTTITAVTANNVVPRNAPAQAINDQGQVTAPWFVGRFITGDGDWGAGVGNRIDLWGNTADDRDVAQTWTPRAQANNPCPPGWRIPSRHEWSDMHTGIGSNPAGTSSSGSYVGLNSYPPAHNTWNWRASQAGAVGGMLITNQNNEILFLPAAGLRERDRAERVANIGSNGSYQSSTLDFITINISLNTLRRLTFGSSNLHTSFTSHRADGLSVRCVSE